MKDKSYRYFQILNFIKKELPQIYSKNSNKLENKNTVNNRMPKKLFENYFKCSSLNEKIEFYNKIDFNDFQGSSKVFMKNFKRKINSEIIESIKIKDRENKKRIFKQHINHLTYEFYICSINKDFKKLIPLKKMIYLFIETYTHEYDYL
ncbi:hypothetical protein DMUE_0078 [Dictyocoela muelleri]|nr:hypothetical protein DMUE_0078 [Dictyocoela muelleri]